ELERELPALEEREHAALEERRGGFVVVREAFVGEQVPVAGIEVELGALDRLGELAGDLDVAELVVGHRVDLEGDALRPRAAELGGRDRSMEEQGSLPAGLRLG